MGRTEDGGENEGLALGDEYVLPSGLIWVAASLLETAGDIRVIASFVPSSFSSARQIQKVE